VLTTFGLTKPAFTQSCFSAGSGALVDEASALISPFGPGTNKVSSEEVEAAAGTSTTWLVATEAGAAKEFMSLVGALFQAARAVFSTSAPLLLAKASPVLKASADAAVKAATPVSKPILAVGSVSAIGGILKLQLTCI
jgi:hypothetical protein